MIYQPRCFALAILLTLLLAPAGWTQGTVTLNPIKDNTLYQDTSGGLSNGAGAHFFAGMTAAGAARRAVLAFDIAGSIPAGSTITSVALTLNMSKTIAGPVPIANVDPNADFEGEPAYRVLLQTAVLGTIKDCRIYKDACISELRFESQ
mgnify:CR=1 FL=1